MSRIFTNRTLGISALIISQLLISASAQAASQQYSLLKSDSSKTCLSIQQTADSKKYQASLQVCEPENKSQLWRFNPRLKQLESYSGLCLHVVSANKMQAKQCDYRRSSNITVNGNTLIYRANPAQQLIPNKSGTNNALILASSHPSIAEDSWQFISPDKHIASLSYLDSKNQPANKKTEFISK